MMRKRHSHAGRKLLVRKFTVETLESRRVLTSYFVNASAAGAGDGSKEFPFATIGQAVAAARVNAGPDEVQIASGTYNENLYFADADGVTLRGAVNQRPVIVSTLPLNVIMPTSSFAFENLVIQSSATTAFNVDTANRPNVRDGDIRLANVRITMSAGVAIYAPELNSLSLVDVSTRGGTVYLEDIDTVSINNLSIDRSHYSGLVANWITDLEIAGLSVTDARESGVLVENSYRPTGFGTPPINVPATADLSNVSVIRSSINGIGASGKLTLNMSDATVTGSTYDGISLGPITAANLSRVKATENSVGIFLSREGALNLTNVVADQNRASGLLAMSPGSVDIIGGSFSENATAGVAIDASRGGVNIASAQINRNAAEGIVATRTAARVQLTDVTTSQNGATGISVTADAMLAASALPDVIVTDSTADSNGFRGIAIDGAKQVLIVGTTSSSNNSAGVFVINSSGAVELKESTFNGNTSTTSETVHGALIQNANGPVSTHNVTANGNEGDGINVLFPVSDVTIAATTAFDNGASGVAVINQPGSHVMLRINDSSLSSNGQNGLFALRQRGLEVSQSHFDHNGPDASSTAPYGNGLWAIGTGLGNIRVENSTAIGTRIGTFSGAGMSFANLDGAATTVSGVTVSYSQIHAATYTPYGGGIVNTGTSSQLRVENSTLTGNRLTDAIGARSVIYSTNPVTVVNTQLLDNDGINIDGLSSVDVLRTTVAGGRGGYGIKMASGSILESTLSGHQQTGIWSAGSLYIANSTITQNSGNVVVDNLGPVSIRNSIVAGNVQGAPLFSVPEAVLSGGYNLLGAMPAEWMGEDSDIVGSLQEPIDPVLSPLADHGGWTLTHMPLAGSPALEAGNPQFNGTVDQRGRVRPISAFGYAVALPDIGSVEADPVNVAPVISLNATSVSGSEGSTLTLFGSVSDLDTNLESLMADRGTIRLEDDGTFQWSILAADDANFTVTLTATDSYGVIGTAQFEVLVSNARPNANLLGLQVDPATQVASLLVSVTDPGTEDSHSVTVDWGDGTTGTYTVDGSGQVAAEHDYARPGNVIISFFATDDDQATSNVETLAARLSGVVVSNGQLMVFGTGGNDVVTLNKRGRYWLDMDAQFGSTPYKATFNASSIDSVFAQLGQGNDQWQGGTLGFPQSIFGEGGDDWIVTGTGNDIVVGGDGADRLETRAGNDMLFGGYGVDVLRGDSGDDILVAGRYQREDDLSALLLLRAVWTGKGSYPSKIDRLRTGAGTDSEGRPIRLAIDTILDADADELFGQAGRDWFLSAGTNDGLDLSKNESRN